MSVAIDPSYEAGYAAGVRDATAWTAAAFGRLQAFAFHVETEAKRLNDACRVEVEIAQKRWAEQDEARRGWPASGAEVEAKPKPVRRTRKKAEPLPAEPCPTLNLEGAAPAAPPTEPGPTLNLDAALPAKDPDAGLCEEEQMRRAAGQAWRA